jgi:hypothetical protein
MRWKTGGKQTFKGKTAQSGGGIRLILYLNRILMIMQNGPNMRLKNMYDFFRQKTLQRGCCGRSRFKNRVIRPMP